MLGPWSNVTEAGAGGHRSVLAWRDGSGVPMVLGHCALLDHRMWEPVVSSLPVGIPVLAYDARGHGPGPYDGSFSFAACVEDLRSYLDARGLDRVHLVGVSMGGAIALEFAVTCPDRVSALTVIATGAKGRGRGGDRAPVTSRAELAQRVDATLHRWLTPRFIAAGGRWVTYVRERIANTDLRLWNDVWAALATRDLTGRLGGIRVPTLCVAGAEDASTPPARLAELAELIPGARFTEVAGPHLCAIERPDAVATLLATGHIDRK